MGQQSMSPPLPGQLRRLLPRLLLLLAIVAAVAEPAGAQSDCENNPTAEACRKFTMADEVLQRDLSRLCAGTTLGSTSYTGWPAACTLWHECRQGTALPASCQPLGLLQTACNEMPGAEACMPYQLMCAPQSVVQQCAQQPPVRELRSAVQLYTEVQKLCMGGSNGSLLSESPACRTCSSQTSDPDKVVVQQLESNCPDPLGSLSALCLVQQRSNGSSNFSNASSQNGSCSVWAGFCQSETGSGFWQLCGSRNSSAAGTLWSSTDDTPAATLPMPTPAPAAPEPVPSPPVASQPVPQRTQAQAAEKSDASIPGMESVASAVLPFPSEAAQPAAGGGSSVSPCYTDPLQESCRSFQQADEASLADVQRLCDSLPGMVGCSLWDQCRRGAATGAYCQPFSVLASICLVSPATDGCQRWARLCTTAGSVVQQCITAAPIRNVMGTSQTMDAVTQACSSRGSSVPACKACMAGWRSCTNPLALLSQLCLASPGITPCRNFKIMCAEAGTTFRSLCGSAARSIAAGTGSSNSSRGGTAGQVPAMSSSSGSSGSEVEPVLKMYIHASMSAMILFQSWVPSSGGTYVASCLAIIAMGVMVQALKALSLQLEARWATRLSVPARAHLRDGFSSPEHSSPAKGPRRSSTASNGPMLQQSMQQSSMAHQQRFITGPELARNVVRSALTGGTVLLEYSLMLAVVTFNLGVIISAILGFCLGALAFGHVSERAAAGGGEESFVIGRTSLQPVSETELDVQYPHRPLPPHTLDVRIL